MAAAARLVCQSGLAAPVAGAALVAPSVLPGAVREAPVMELSRSQQLRRPAQQWTAAEERPSAAAAAASASARAIPPPWRPLLPSG